MTAVLVKPPCPANDLEPFTPRLQVWRCPKCGQMLARIHLAPGSMIEIKCGKCNAFAIREAA